MTLACEDGCVVAVLEFMSIGEEPAFLLGWLLGNELFLLHEKVPKHWFEQPKRNCGGLPKPTPKPTPKLQRQTQIFATRQSQSEKLAENFASLSFRLQMSLVLGQGSGENASSI
jgi:hypothetical protein